MGKIKLKTNKTNVWGDDDWATPQDDFTYDNLPSSGSSYQLRNVKSKLNHIKNVIGDPDGYNTNLASKDRVISLEQQVEELYDKVETLSSRLNGISYLLKSLINNKSIDDDDIDRI